jgi:acetyltransferase-like isoleucine patch superfamily enzyme
MVLNQISSTVIRQWYKKFYVSWYKLLSSAEVHGKPILNQPCLFIGQGKIFVGNNVNIGYYPSPHYFNSYCHIEARNPKSSIEIGDNSRFNNNVTIISHDNQIKIGSGVLVGMNVLIINSDFHPLQIHNRIDKNVISKPIVIGNNVFIGANSIILKGVTIGQNSVIGAGSVVTHNISSNSVVAGNPAKVIKKINTFRK